MRDYAKRFQRGHWSCLGPGNEEKWCGTYCLVLVTREVPKRKGGRNTMTLHSGIMKHSTYCAQFTWQISSVPTEQYRVGVMSQLNRCLGSPSRQSLRRVAESLERCESSACAHASDRFDQSTLQWAAKYNLLWRRTVVLLERTPIAIKHCLLFAWEKAPR